jgi:hypothetical protein
MPINYKKYPANWKTEIRPAILKRANNCCEKCGVDNYAVVYWDEKNKEWIRACGNIHIDAYGNGECSYSEARMLADLWNENDDPYKWIVVCLTIAHLDHDVNNNDHTNLKALCQRCHLRLDSGLHRKNVKETIRKKKGLQNLF